MALILFVEDESTMLEMMAEIADLAGYQVLTAVNGKVALEILRSNSHKIDAVFTDLNMPVMGGIELMKKAKAEGISAPFVVVSGNLEQFATDEAKQAGAFEYLPKPFKVPKLEELMKLATEAGEKIHPEAKAKAS